MRILLTIAMVIIGLNFKVGFFTMKCLSQVFLLGLIKSFIKGLV